MDKDKKPFDVIDGDKPDSEPYKYKPDPPLKELLGAILPPEAKRALALIPRGEIKKIVELAEQNPNLDVTQEVKKLMFKYAKGIPEKE